jgi:outer membrane biosynthesis protein TonB
LLNTRFIVPAVAVGLIALVALLAGRHPFRSHPKAPLSDSGVAQTNSQQAVSPVADPQSVKSSAPAAVLHQEIPALSRSSRQSIRGQIKVTVRVTADRSGNVVGQTLEDRGSSRYFAQLATETAKKWKFAPLVDRDSREWLLEFDFTRGGVVAQATPRSTN